MDEFNFLYGAILLFGAEPVIDAAEPHIDTLDNIGREMADLARLNEGASATERWRATYPAYRQALIQQQSAVIVAMRADVTRDIHEREDSRPKPPPEQDLPLSNPQL
jgi:hypothetical protein